MSIAVVLATYNGERFLPAQLESIAAQTRRPDRLVVTDDGSTDGTCDVVHAFAARHPDLSVELLEGPRTGLADNFWHGLGAADTDLVAWADQDDVWAPRKLEALEAALEAHGAAFAVHSARVVGADGATSGRRYPDYARDEVLEPLAGDPWEVPSGFASMFRRSLLDGVDVREAPVSHQTGRRMNHDHVVSLVAFAAARRVRLRASLADYRQHGHNVAGDPTVLGGDVVRVALRVGSEQYARLAERTQGYAAFVGGLEHADPDAVAHLERCAHLAERRAGLYAARGRPRRMVSLARNAYRGDYRSRHRAGLGSRSLARDLLEVVRTGRPS